MRRFRVLDLSQIWAGPYCTKLLGEMGAQVIKVESLRRLDPARALHVFPPGTSLAEPWNLSGLFLDLHQGQLSLTLDLTDPRGREIFLRLVRIADVVVENFTPGVMASFGLDWPRLQEANPALVYLAMPGFGSDGPYRDFRGMGNTLEPAAGISWLTGYEDGPPIRSGISYGDPIAGLYGALAVLAALYRREGTGRGQHVEVAQTEGLAALIPDALADAQLNGRNRRRMANRDPSVAPHGVYPCAADPADEAEWVAIECPTDAAWRGLVRAMGTPPWAQERRLRTAVGRVRAGAALDHRIATWTARHSARAIEALLQAVGVPAGRVYTTGQVTRDTGLTASGFWRDVPHREGQVFRLRGVPWQAGGHPPPAPGRAPDLGEHNEMVLRDLLGCDEATLAALAAAQVIGRVPIA